MSEEFTTRGALPPGTRVQEFEFLGVLDQGGFGITYLGWDYREQVDVAIKEYMPGPFAMRDSDGFVCPITEDLEEDYYWGMREFLKEARMLVAFEHPNIVPVRKWFEAHDTAYFVMDYLEGQTLFALYQAQRTLNENRLRALLRQVLAGLEQVHASGYLHCDIKPGNIMLKRDGTPVLIDFGAAQAATAARSRIEPVVTPGYSAVEQYGGTRHDYGPWTDMYAVGALLYRGMTEIVPAEAPDRRRNDDLVPVSQAARRRYDKALTDAVDWALRVEAGERPQSIHEWLEILERRQAPDDHESGPVVPPSDRPSPPPSIWRRLLVACAVVAFVAALGFAATAAWQWSTSP